MKTFLGRIFHICAYRAIYLQRFLTRPKKFGVQLILRYKDKVLFVQHVYMHRGLWDCPGGGIDSDEEPIETLKREAKEELGIDLKEIKFIGVCELYHDYIHDHVTIFEAQTDSQDLIIDPKEIKIMEWFPVTNPPSNLAELTRNVWEIYKNQR